MSVAKNALGVLLAMALILALAACTKNQQESVQPQAPVDTQQAAAPPQTQETPAAPEVSPAPTTAKPIAQQRPKSVENPTARPAASKQVSTATMGERAGEVAHTPAAEQPAPAPKAVEPKYAVIERGTKLQVRLQDPLDSSVNKSGDTFQAILDKDIVVDGHVVAPRGSILQGKLSNVARSGRVEGRATMALELTSLTVGGQTYPLRTDILSFEAESSAKKDATKVGVGAGLGAVIGAIAGGGKGAAIGAAVGAGAGGATVLATRGKEVKFEAEQAFSFELLNSISVRIH